MQNGAFGGSRGDKGGIAGDFTGAAPGEPHPT
jgi:hypothetical protein